MPADPNPPQSFVLRMRIDDASAGTVRPEILTTKDSPPRLHIRIEHVDSREIAQLSSIPDALTWLETRMRRLFPQASSPQPPTGQP